MDLKYGRVFTEEDVLRILWWVNNEQSVAGTFSPDKVIELMDKAGANFKFPANEPTFTLRARDRRALGAIKHYLHHQSPRAAQNHLDGIEAAEQDFLRYRTEHSDTMHDPD